MANPNQTGFKPIAKRLLLPIFFRFYDAFLCTGSRSRAYLRALGVADERIFYYTYAVDQAWFAAGAVLTPAAKHNLKHRLGLPLDKPVILAVAKFSPRETPWDLLKALPHLIADSACLLVGEGPERGLIAAYIESQPGLTVRLPGYVHYPELPSIYGIADVFVHAAQDEPYGVSVAEALACGLPVITSDRVGAAYDLLEDDCNGSIYPLGDVVGLAKKLDGWLLRGMDAAAQRRTQAILSRWDYQNTAAEIERCAQYVTQESRSR